MIRKLTPLALLSAGLLCQTITTARVSAQTSFSVVLNEGSNFGDSRKSVSFFDVDNLNDGPLFSVFTGYESSNNFDEVNAIDVNPATGDVYVLAYDSGTAGNIDAATIGSDGEDTEGDYDLLRINFSTIFNDWKTNYQGTDVRSPSVVGGPAPTAGGYANSSNLDYVTYGARSPNFTPFDFDVTHSNTVVLPDAIEKIGEVKRNVGDTTGFHIPSLEFVDADTLLVIDDSNEDATLDNASNDHTYRIIERVSTSPGSANDASSDHLDGGFNRGTTESWNSRSLGVVNLDFDLGGSPIGHSEIESSAFHQDSLTGVRGMWVTESDGGGDDIAFLEIDSSGNSLGYRPHAVGAGPTFPTSFAFDNDPAVNSSSNDGKADNIFVDADTGDLIIIESGFGDSTDGIGPDHEPAVIRREVLSYDNGLGQIQFGAWDSKVILDPSTETPGENPSFLERGQWASYDSENDTVYFWNPGNGGSESPSFGLDVWALDINTGVTTAYLDLDDSVSLFQGDGFGDKTDFFTLATEEDADFDGDTEIDGIDFLAWQRGFLMGGQTDNSQGDANLSGVVDGIDFDIWKSQFGTAAVPLAGSFAVAIPEPSAGILLLIGLSAMPVVASRKSRFRS